MAMVVKEMWARMPAKVGLLAEVAQAIAGAGVNIKAMVAFERDGKGDMMFVTDDNAAAASAAAALGAETGEDDVVAVELADSPGSLADAAGKIAGAGVNVVYAYGSTCGCDAAMIYFKCDDAAAAASALG